MTDRFRRRLAGGLWILLLTLLIGALLLTLTPGGSSVDPFLLIAVPSILGYGTVGAIIASRGRGNPIGWLMMAMSLGFILGGFTDEYATQGIARDPGSLPLATAAAWVTSWISLLVPLTISLILLLFPDGRPPSSRWRPAAWLTVASVALLAASVIVDPRGLTVTVGVMTGNPTGVPALAGVVPVATWVGGLGMLAGVLLSAASLVVRFRRSRDEERQQIRWLAAVASLGGVLLLGALLTAIGLGADETSTVNEALFFSMAAFIGLGVPVAVGVAVLKYRLYELDLVIRKTVVFGILVVLIVGVALGLLLVLSSPLTAVFPDETQAVGIVGVVIGLLVWPLRRLAVRIADRVVFGGRASPYEVLTDLAGRMSGTYSTEEILPRMAQILAGATRAGRATVWLRVGQELRPEATTGDRPPAPVRVTGDRLPALAGGERAFEVRHQGDLLGAVSVTMPASDPMNPAKEKLVRDLAAQAGLVLRNVRLIEELRESRRRIVSAQDEERRRLERNLHDGAQQQLVALAVKLRLAEGLVERDAAKAREALAVLQQEAAEALDELRDLARGIYPPLLADRGLPSALEAQARKSPVPFGVEADGVGRYPQEVEAAVYFCCLEALQNVAKYAAASSVSIRLAEADGHLAFEVRDDGQGFDPVTARSGTGLQGMTDRLDAIGGTLEVRSSPGAGTVVAGRAPIGRR